jgi:ABC-2 type transport system permease protein
MNGPALELVAGPLRALRRSILWWSVGLASLVAATVAFWPAFEGSSGMSTLLDQLPSGMIDAFGLADFGTPAGYLRANLYDFFMPLLLAIAAVAMANGQTAGEEANGRLELYLAQPVDRRSVLLGRAMAVLVALAIITVVLAVVQFAGDAAVDLRIDSGYLASTIVLSGLLGLLHGSLAVAIAGVWARPSLVMGVGIGVAIAGCVIAALFPLSDVLAPWGHLSPWDWAFAGDPLGHPTEAWRYVALALPSVALTALGVLAVSRRDIAAA